MARKLILSGRLGLIAAFIGKGSSVADIGTDHGLIPVYLAQNGLARGIVASDISAGSLEAALRCAAKHDVTDKITFVVAPGLAGVDEKETDTVITAGMGGDTIAEILREAPWTRSRGVTLILQPQTKTGALCRWLSANGYAIRDAGLAREKGRFYIVMLARGCCGEQGSGAGGAAPSGGDTEQRGEIAAALSGGGTEQGSGAGGAEPSGGGAEQRRDSAAALCGVGAEQGSGTGASRDETGGADMLPRPGQAQPPQAQPTPAHPPPPCLRDPEAELLALLKEKRDPLFADFIDNRIAGTRRALEGMAKARHAPEYMEMVQKLEQLTIFGQLNST